MKNVFFLDQEITEDDLYFLCYIIECTARRLHQRNQYVVDAMGYEEISKKMSLASVLHSEKPEQVVNDFIEEYAMKEGFFDITNVDRELVDGIPTATQMGKVYKRLILQTLKDGEDYAQGLIRVYHSPICKQIDNYNCKAYYKPFYILAEAYRKGSFEEDFVDAFAAHIRKDGTVQSVYEHLENVGAFCGIYGRAIGLESCGILTGQLHDMGKLTSVFNSYIRAAQSNIGGHAKGPDHSTAGAVWIMSLLNDKSSEIERLTAQLIALAIMWHHGGLGDIYDEFGKSAYLKRLAKLEDKRWSDEYLKITEVFEMQFSKKEMYTLFGKATEEVEAVLNRIIKGNIQQSDFKYTFGLLCKYLYSCLIDADRYDTSTFMDGQEMKPPQDNQSTWEKLAAIAELKMQQMDTEKPINVLRHQLSDACLASAEKKAGIYELNSPTGSGKTLSVFRYALNHAKKYKKDRIFYIVPLISIIDQNSEVLKDFLKEDKEDTFIEQFFLELHSAKEEDVTDEDQLKEAELLAERMDSPIVITTMVRFLNTFFKGGTRNPRAIHNFANSIIIFDEIQTLPIKCTAMFNGLINLLTSVCKATIVLSTATQPGFAHMPDKIPSMRIEQGEELSGCTEMIREKFRRTKFNLDMLPSTGQKDNSAKEIANQMKFCLKEHAHILGVFNTKNSALKVYETLKADGPKDTTLYFLSTNLCPAHRKDKLIEIKEKMATGEKIVVVSTQLIEAGVDLDFDIVFRALAGLDSLIQAAGRCNRHGEKDLGLVYLIRPAFENLTNLTSIQKGKESTLKLINRFNTHPEEFDGQLDSQKAVAFYYCDYFFKEKDHMTYPFKIKGEGWFEMYKLLNMNGKLKQEAINNGIQFGKPEWEPILCQSFGLVGHHFEPIDTAGRSVLVPYKEGSVIIDTLLSAGSYENKNSLLRKAQQYCVNLTESKYRKIKGGVEFYEELGVNILHKDYYDSEEKGLLDEQECGVLMF